MRHLMYGTNSPLISASLVRHSLLHFLLSHMAVHHLQHLDYHHLHLLLLVQSFILNLILGSSANPFLGKSSESIQWASLPNRYSALCWRPVTHAQTWANSALYRFGRLSLSSTGRTDSTDKCFYLLNSWISLHNVLD